MIPFGFSAGDFAIAIGLIVRISKALKDSGAAAAECRDILEDLQTLQQLLRLLERLRPADGSVSDINAIRGMALACRIPLLEFVKKIESYEPALGVSSSKGMFARGVKKVQWAILFEEEVAKFRGIIAAKVRTITLLLGFFNSDALSRMESQHRDNQKTILDKMNNNKESLASHMSELSLTHHGALSTKISHFERNIREDVSNIAQETRVGNNELIERSDIQIHELKGLSCRLDQVHKENSSNLSQVVGLFSPNMLKVGHRFTMARHSFRRTEKQLLSVEKRQADTQSQLSVGFRSVLREISILASMGRSFFSMLVPFSEKALEYLRKNMKANMEIYALLLKIQTSIPQGMFLSQQDSIHFEDVLGRKKLLPYDYFRHWDVFDSMLRCEFKGLPGEWKVRTGDYVLMNSQVQGVTISKESWQRMVFPGTHIKMSVVLRAFRVLGGSCPRPQCPGTVEIDAKSPVIHCPVCALAFVRLIAGEAQRPRLVTSEQGRQEHFKTSPPLKARESNDIQAFRMVHVRQDPSQTEEIQRFSEAQKSSTSYRSGPAQESNDIQGSRIIHERQGSSQTEELQRLIEAQKSPNSYRSGPAQESNDIMVDRKQGSSQTGEIQRLIEAQKSPTPRLPGPDRCNHYWSYVKGSSDLLQWNCQRCHSGPHWFIRKCQHCEARYCSVCTQKV